jgi:hypothetical protein
MDISSKLRFGKYKGRTIEEVWLGIVRKSESEIIQLYIFELIDFFVNKGSDKLIPKSTCNLSQHGLEIHYLSFYNCDVKIKVSSKNIIIRCEDMELTRLLIKIIIAELSASFDLYKSNKCWNRNLKYDYSQNSILFRNLNSNPEYIKWCIEEIESFKIKDIERLMKIKCRYFYGFELISINDNFLSYFPKFVYYDYTFPEETISLNNKKYSFRDTNMNFRDYGWESDEEEFCTSCQEFPCRCSGRGLD